MFNWFKKKQAKLDPIDFSDIKVDIHSHLIPGIDDGAKSIEDSLALIKKLKKYGYKKIITTPHVMSDLYKNNSTTILSGLEKMKIQSKDNYHQKLKNLLFQFFVQNHSQHSIQQQLQIQYQYFLH